jgi:hypothetical protein
MAKSCEPNVFVDWDKGGIQISFVGTDGYQETPAEEILEVGNFSAVQFQYGLVSTMTGGNTTKLHLLSAMSMDGPWAKMTPDVGLDLTDRTTLIDTLDGAADAREMYRYLKWQVTDDTTVSFVLQLKVLLRR